MTSPPKACNKLFNKLPPSPSEMVLLSVSAARAEEGATELVVLFSSKSKFSSTKVITETEPLKTSAKVFSTKALILASLKRSL